MLGFLFAAIINTGIGSAWLLLHIAHNSKWASRITEEQKKIIEEFKSGEPGDSKGKETPQSLLVYPSLINW